MRNGTWTVIVATGLLAACAGDVDTEIEDGEDDEFLGGGKEDSPVDEGTPEACAVKKLANLADFDTLDDDVRLSSRAARNIVAFREGPDGELDTHDDGWFVTLEDLDDIKYVGPATFRRMVEHATEDEPDAWTCGPVDVQLLAFNDFHGNLTPPSGSSGRIVTAAGPVDAGGVEYLATHLAALAATNPNTTIVAAGDIVGATPLLSAAFHDEPSVESMNLLGLAVSSVGNHEFDHGPDELLRLQYGGCHPVDGCQDGDGFAGAAFAYLGANVIDEATDEPLLASYAIRHYGNARIGFIGLTLEGTALVTTAAGTAGLYFRDEADTINQLVPELEAKGVHAIVVLIHEGGAQTGLYDACSDASGPIMAIVAGLDPAIDVVVSGHTHNAYDCVVGDVLLTSAAHAGRIVTDIDLTVDEATGAVTARDAANVIVTRTVAKDPAQTALIDKYSVLIAPIANRVIGNAAGDLTRIANPAGETTMGDVIADAQLAGSAAQGAVAAFMNPGGVRADVLAGEITYGEAFAVQPFANNLVTLDVTGAQLDTMLEQQWSPTKVNLLQISSSVRYAWSAAAPIGSKVDAASIQIDGVVVSPTATYRITVNSFLADGGDGFSVLKQGTNRVPGLVDLEALEQYLTAHTPLAVPALDRVTLLP